MVSVRGLFALAVVTGLVIFSSACRKPPVHQLGPFYIMLTYNNGNCQQNGSNGVIDVPYDQSVIYQGASVLSQFNIGFSSCPFASGNCPVNSPNGSPMNVGLPTDAARGNTYNYSSMIVNGQQCTMGGPMGVRIRNP